MRTPASPLLAACVLLAAALLPSAAEARRGDPPASMTRSLTTIEQVEQLTLAPRDINALLAEDEIRAAEGYQPYRYADVERVEVTPATHGTWETLADGARVWRLRVFGDGATDLNMGLRRFWLPAGATLHVWSESEDYYEGPYTHLDNEAHGELWVPVVPGGRAVIELYVPAAVKFEPELRLTDIGFGYKDLFDRSHPLQGSCNNDVICPEGDPWRAEIASVAAYSRGGSIICTGQMIMDVPGTFRSFFLTAYHCGMTAGNAPSMVVYWNFESPNCGDLCCGSLADNQTGAIFRASRQDVDMCLVELDDDPDPTSGVYWAGWDRSGVAPNGSVGIHHPGGDEKAISFNFDPLTTMNSCIGGGGSQTHWRVNNWEDGTTEPGSSGSGLWDMDSHLLVGFLSGGAASCSNISYDCYGKFSLAWDGSSASNRLRDWLDPGNVGPLTVAGSYPSGAGALLYAGHVGNDACNTNPDNDNGVWEPGETIELIVELRAIGGSLTGISGTLSTTTPGVTIVDGNATWPDIPSGSTASSNEPHFTVELDATVPCETDVELQLSVSANESGPFPSNFSNQVGQPVVAADLPVSIPDNSPPGATSTLSVADSFVLTDVDARVAIAHTWVGDLQIFLIAPDGTQVTLLDRPGVPASTYGCSDNDMDVTFDDASGFQLESHCQGTTPWYAGPAAPVTPLAVLSGKNVQGDWRVRVVDNAVQDTGSLIDWQLLTDPPLVGQCEICEPTAAAGEQASAPLRFGLRQNRPNPFNPYTDITFDLTSGGRATLEIFDVGGRLVRTLVDETMPAGTHQASWDGTDAQGRPVATGIYFYRLELGEEVEVRRMSLVR